MGKCEHMNPGGTIKDRIALAMIEDAEDRGLIQPGGTFVEATGGSTGVGLGIVAAAKGYKVKCTMPDKTAKEKIDNMSSYGIENTICPTTHFKNEDHICHVAAKIASENPNHYYCN